MKIKSLIVFMFFVAFSCLKLMGKEYEIKGTVVGNENEEIYLKVFSNKMIYKTVRMDTAKIVDGKFFFKGEIEEDCVGSLYIDPRLLSHTIMLEDAVFEVLIDCKKYHNTHVVGGNEQKIYDEYNLIGSKFRRQYDVLKKKFIKNEDLLKNGSIDSLDFGKCKAKVMKAYDSVQNIEIDERLNYLKQFPKSVASAWLVYKDKRLLLKNPDAYKNVLLAFEEPVNKYCYIKSMLLEIRSIEATSIGKMAPDFELGDKTGKMYKLSDFRGKYVLVDFWASWCGPCRKEIPNIKRQYETFYPLGLEIISVSVDTNIEKWHKALEEEQMPWLQLSAPAGFKSNVIRDYGISGIPFIILIGPDGKIVAPDLRGNKLQKKLESIFGQ